jgi:hypothetical protein
MVSAQSVPQYGVRDRLDLVQSTAPVSRSPLAQPRGARAAAGESGAAERIITGADRLGRLLRDIVTVDGGQGTPTAHESAKIAGR